MRFITDSDLKVHVSIVSRTAKFAVIKIRNEEKRVKIYSYDNAEYILPEGKYSMAPRAKATNQIKK